MFALWVAPAVRHLRGGELLLNAALEWLVSEGATQVYAWVTDSNTTAMRFYERLGFQKTGKTEPYPNDSAIIEYEMVLPLNP